MDEHRKGGTDELRKLTWEHNRILKDLADEVVLRTKLSKQYQELVTSSSQEITRLRLEISCLEAATGVSKQRIQELETSLEASSSASKQRIQELETNLEASSSASRQRIQELEGYLEDIHNSAS